MNHGEKITVYGLPINPRHLVEELVEPSFCVSYATRGRLGKQLQQAITMVADTGILLTAAAARLSEILSEDAAAARQEQEQT